MKKILKIMLVVLLVFILTGCKEKIKNIESFPEYVNNLNSYKVTGKLYSMFPTGTKESLITVYYQKPDLYRVEIDNSGNGEKQVILKNPEGVYVLVPSVNKSFKLKSSWPINSTYPYLLQSISKDYVNDEDKLITKDDQTTQIEMDIVMFENARPSKQKVIFDNETNHPKEVQIFDEQANLITRFVYLNIEENLEINEELFKKEQTMTSYFEQFYEIEYTRENTYPTYYPENTKLQDEKTYSQDNIKTVIMIYSGNVNYTIIENHIYRTENETTDYLDGSIYVMGDYVGIIGTNNLTLVSNGMEYFIASNEITTLEMFKMANSLITTATK